MHSWSIWKVKQKGFVVPALWNKGKRSSQKTDQSEWPPRHTEKKRPDSLVKWSQSVSSPCRDHGVANEPSDCLTTTHRDKRVWINHQLNEQTHGFIWVDGETRDLKKKKKRKKNNKPCVNVEKNEQENKSMVDHQKHLRAERWTSVWEEQVYIPPEERQQPKSWEQTNKRRGKETNINQIKW